MSEIFEKDILQEVDIEDISKIQKVMMYDWPQDFLFYQIITIMQENRKLNKQSPTQVLYKFGDFESGVFLMDTTFTTNSNIWKCFIIYTKSEDLSSLTKVLQETARIPWGKGNFIFELNFKRLTPIVEQTFAFKGVDPKKNETMMFWFPSDEAITFREIPNNVYLDYLDESHMTEVNNNWPFKSEFSQGFLTQNMTSNFGLGLFRKSDIKLLSSSISFYSGGLFVLFTDSKFRGNGYGEIIVQNMVKEIRNRGRIPFCTIMLGNTTSEKLFRKLGFKEFCQLDFICDVQRDKPH